MIGHEKFAPNCAKGGKHPRIPDLVGPELAFDHVSARYLEYGHRINFANEVLRIYPFNGARAIDGTAFIYHDSRSTACFATNPESSCLAVRPSNGWRQSGAISASGMSTNRRSCSRGCGKTRRDVLVTWPQ